MCFLLDLMTGSFTFCFSQDKENKIFPNLNKFPVVFFCQIPCLPSQYYNIWLIRAVYFYQLLILKHQWLTNIVYVFLCLTSVLIWNFPFSLYPISNSLYSYSLNLKMPPPMAFSSIFAFLAFSTYVKFLYLNVSMCVKFGQRIFQNQNKIL